MVAGTPFLPGLSDYRITKLQFQGRIHGHHTDDLICHLDGGDGSIRKRLVQVKRTLTVRKSDAQLEEALAGAWNDYNSLATFVRGQDTIAIVSSADESGPTKAARDLTQLARTCEDFSELDLKLKTPGASSNPVRDAMSTLRGVLDKITGRSICDDVFFSFLRHVFFESRDLATDDSRETAYVLALIKCAFECPEVPSAQATWSQLVHFAAEQNQRGATLTIENWRDLAPVSLRSALAGRVGYSTVRADIERLAAHSRLVLGSVAERLPNGVQIQRPVLEASILEHIEGTQVVLITGAAGYGKSVLAKVVSLAKSEQTRVLAFKAEDLDRSSLAGALTDLGARQGVQGLTAAIESSPSPFILLDGLEKVAEFEHREAVAQLLGVLRGHEGARAIITVRSHAVEMVYSILLADFSVKVINVPPLNDGELELALRTGPLDYSKICGSSLAEVLRVPFYLRLALTHSTLVSAVPSQSLTDLKQFLWLHAVTNPASAIEEMPERRRRTFDEVCLLRAQRVAQFVQCPSDTEAVSALLNDGILIADEHGQVAPAHDIFDDWSLHNYIQRNVVVAEYDWPSLFETVGRHPGMRRAYRSWLAEAATRKEPEALDLVRRTLDDLSIPPFWRDDSLVGLLRSEHAPAFIDEHQALLVQDGMARLRLLVHLLRVACKGPREDIPEWPLDDEMSVEARIRYALTMPVGGAWGKVIQLVSSHLDILKERDRTWIAGLIEDWLAGERDFYHPNETTRAAFAIGLHVLQGVGVTRREQRELKKRFLGIVLKTLGADPEKAAAFLQAKLGSLKTDSYCRASDGDDILRFALEFINCGPLCYYLPDFTITALWFLYVSLDRAQGKGWHHEFNIEPDFGFHTDCSSQFFAPSAYQGPFWMLLQTHPAKAVVAIVALCNHAAETARNSTLRREFIELAVPFLPQGQKFLFSERMWLTYRGTAVAPDMLKSALMALEKWFMDTRAAGADVTQWLEYVLHNGRSAFTASVVASVLTAHPSLCSGKFLDLFRVRELIEVDRIRIVHESHALAPVSPRQPGMSEFMQRERVESNKLPHRRTDLESLIFRLQIEAPPLREALWQILDDHKAALNPGDNSEDAQLWRLALKRMDLREMKLGEPTGDGYIPLEIHEMEPDLRQMVEEGADRERATSVAMRLFLWGSSFFDANAEQHRSLYPSHVEALAEFRRFEQEPTKEGVYIPPNLPALIAAALIRLDSDEVGEETRAWAESEVCKVVYCAGEYDDVETMQRFSIDGSRPAAYVLSLALSRTQHRELLLKALGEALTHPVVEIREYAARGVRQFLWKGEPALARVCVLGLAHLAVMVGAALDVPYNDHRAAWGQAFRAAQTKLFNALKAGALDEPKLDQPLRHLHDLTLALRTVPFDIDWDWLRSATGMLVEAAMESERRGQGTRKLSYEEQDAIANLYARQLLYASPERLRAETPRLTKLCKEAPEFAAMVLDDVLVEQDSAGGSVTNFWQVWDVATRVCYPQLNIMSHGGGYHSNHEKLLRTLLFQSMPWKPNVYDLAILCKRPSFIKDSIRAVGANAIGFECAVKLLEGVGRGIGVPDALIELQKALDGHTRENPLEKRVILWELETVVRVAIYEHGPTIKRNSPLRTAVLILLDKMVDAGSSVAFQLRDYFVTAPAKEPVFPAR
jgi:hypothetical protein